MLAVSAAELTTEEQAAVAASPPAVVGVVVAAVELVRKGLLSSHPSIYPQPRNTPLPQRPFSQQQRHRLLFRRQLLPIRGLCLP